MNKFKSFSINHWDNSGFLVLDINGVPYFWTGVEDTMYKKIEDTIRMNRNKGRILKKLEKIYGKGQIYSSKLQGSWEDRAHYAREILKVLNSSSETPGQSQNSAI
jgi:hypothetical protein